MANSIITQLFRPSSLTITDESAGAAVWDQLKVMSVEITSTADIAKQPLSTKDLTESNVYQSILDVDVNNGKIINPVNLTIIAFVADVSTIEDIELKYADVTSSFTITSKEIISTSMALLSVEINQSQENTSSSRVTLIFSQSEAQILNSFSPLNPSDQKTYGIRVQSLPDTLTGIVDNAINSAASTASRVAASVRGLYNKVFGP